METLHIENFAGLVDVRIEVAPITVLIGPQASGKSVISKLLFYFREIIWRMDPWDHEEEWNATFYRQACQDRFKRYFPPSTWNKGTATITYHLGTHHFIISLVSSSHSDLDGEAELKWSKVFLNLFSWHKQETKSYLDDLDSDEHPDPDDHFFSRLAEAIGPNLIAAPEFIPAGRTFFAQVQATIFRTLEADAEIDPFLISFGATLERTRRWLSRHGFFGEVLTNPLPKVKQRLSPLITTLHSTLESILHAKLEKKGKKESIKCVDGRRVSLAQASSGQQEVLPLLLILSRATLQLTRIEAVHIEEPEAHLFPDAQREVVEFIGEVFSAPAKQVGFVITTHSPYILTALNNLLQAGLRYADSDEATARKLESIIPSSRALSPGVVNAYSLDEGRATSILDPETKLIDAAMVDEVSNDLAIQFDRLLWEE